MLMILLGSNLALEQIPSMDFQMSFISLFPKVSSVCFESATVLGLLYDYSLF